jgi:hypothetical protein
MSYAIKQPFNKTMSEYAGNRFSALQQVLKKAVPVTVDSLEKNGTIATVKLEVDSAFTLPKIKMPVYGPEYIRWPLQKGAKGVMLSSDLALGAMSGLGEGVARLTVQPNLSTGVFFPIGNTSFEDTDDPQATVIYGPNGVILRDDKKKSVLTLTPTILQYALNDYVNAYIDKTQIKLSFKNASGDCTLIMDANGIRLDAFGNEIKIDQNGVTNSHGNNAHFMTLTDGGFVFSTPANIQEACANYTLNASANYTMNASGTAALTAPAMNVTGTSTANYNGPSGYALQFNGSSGTLYGNGTQVQVTPSQAQMYTPWNVVTLNSSNGLMQNIASGSYVQVTGSSATLDFSGAYAQMTSNAITLNSAGSLTLTAPNGQQIYMDPSRVGIQGMNFNQHEHAGVQSGGSYTSPPSGP